MFGNDDDLYELDEPPTEWFEARVDKVWMAMEIRCTVDHPVFKQFMQFLDDSADQKREC